MTAVPHLPSALPCPQRVTHSRRPLLIGWISYSDTKVLFVGCNLHIKDLPESYEKAVCVYWIRLSQPLPL